MMYIARVNPKKPHPHQIENAVAALRCGGLVVYPTETAYALGCDASSTAAMRKIYLLKGRPGKKPLPMIVASKKLCDAYFPVRGNSARLAKAFWPGPLTLILHAKDGVETAVRVSSSPVARALSDGIGGPIVSTSANRSGSATTYDVMSVLRDLGIVPDVVLDAGRLPKRKTSTIVRCAEGRCEVLRDGAVSRARLKKIIPER